MRNNNINKGYRTRRRPITELLKQYVPEGTLLRSNIEELQRQPKDILWRYNMNETSLYKNDNKETKPL
jgi:hypothetical protein